MRRCVLLPGSVALALITARCAGPSAATSPPHVTRPSDVLATAAALQRSLDHATVPAGVEAVITELHGIARSEDGTTRADEARRAIASLHAARYRIEGHGADFEGALDAWGRLVGVDDDRAALCRDAHSRDPGLRDGRCPTPPSPTVVPASRAARALPAAPLTAPRPRFARIVIDPGHGGTDPGARAESGLAESAVTLDVSRQLASRLAETLGSQVVLTRDSDTYVPLEDRAQRANAFGADLFLSIHCNATSNPESHGVATYVLDTASDRVAERIASRENEHAAGDPLSDPDVTHILADLQLVGPGSRSAPIASAIQHGLVQGLRARYGDIVDLGVHPARFHVLVGARMPAVLLELSFLSNPSEAQRLGDRTYRSVLVDAIVEALATFPR